MQSDLPVYLFISALKISSEGSTFFILNNPITVLRTLSKLYKECERPETCLSYSLILIYIAHKPSLSRFLAAEGIII